MKTLSSSIVVLAGAIIFSSGAFWQGQAAAFPPVVGFVVIFVGLCGWARELSKGPND